MIIKVVGTGCARCTEAENIVATAVREAGGTATVEKITDIKEMMLLGIMSTPAVVIDGRIMCAGRLPSGREVREWIAGKGGAAGGR